MVYVVSNQELSSTFKVCYVPSKYPHLCSAYLVTMPFFFLSKKTRNIPSHLSMKNFLEIN